MINSLDRCAAIAVSTALICTPIAAAELPLRAAQPSVAASAFDADSVNAANHHRWYRRNRVDAGDVIGGLLVIGTIAAVASAASKASRNDRYRDRDYRYRDYRSDYRRPYDSRFGESRGLQNAADMCAREVDRARQVGSVDGVVRSAQGWEVTGSLRTGEPFTCRIGNDGRIETIDYGRRGLSGADRQWDDDRYAAARAAQDGAMPAYPGGPIGDEE